MDSYNEAQKYLKRRITEVTTGKFHGTKVDRTLMSELLNDVIADYKLKDRHSVNKMARPLIENRLIPYFGRARATNVKVPTITAYMRKRKEEEARCCQRQPGTGAAAQGIQIRQHQRQDRFSPRAGLHPASTEGKERAPRILGAQRVRKVPGRAARGRTRHVHLRLLDRLPLR